MKLEIIIDGTKDGYNVSVNNQYDIKELDLSSLEKSYVSMLEVFNNIDQILLTVEGVNGDDMLIIKIKQRDFDFKITIDTKEKRTKKYIDKVDFRILNTLEYLKTGYYILVNVNNINDLIDTIQA